MQLEVDRARIQQQDLALSIRKREVELEQERRRTAAVELAALKSQRETLEKRIEYARKTVLASFDVSDRGIVPDPHKFPASLQRAKLLRENMLKRLLMYRGDSKNYIADGTALNFFVELCGTSAFAGRVLPGCGRGKAGQGPNPAGVNGSTARECDPHQSAGSCARSATSAALPDRSFRDASTRTRSTLIGRPFCGPRSSGRIPATSRNAGPRSWPSCETKRASHQNPPTACSTRRMIFSRRFRTRNRR